MRTALQTAPDGLEVVASLEGGSRGPLAPLLVLDRLEAHLDYLGFEAGPLAWERVGDGQSNITYRLQRGGRDLVLRRGPRPPHQPSTHDMVREANIQRVLHAEGVPVPEIVAICEDDSVLGVPFYLMTWLEGEVITSQVPAALDAPETRRGISRQLVTQLARLHAVDVTRGPAASLGRPEGYLERQVRRFRAVWDEVATRDLPEVEKLATWLDENRPLPQASAVVHGDYRLGNIMFAPTAPARPLAILDWELATLGDPLADLGYLTATYSDPGTPPTPLQLSRVTAGAGFLRSDEIINEYAALAQLDVSGLAWYQTFALWKAAVFCEAIYGRWLKGERPGDTTFGPTLEQGIPALLREAERYRQRL